MPKFDPQTGEEIIEQDEIASTVEDDAAGDTCSACIADLHTECELTFDLGFGAIPCKCFCRQAPEVFDEPYSYLIAFRDKDGRRFFHRGNSEWISNEIRTILSRLAATAHRGKS
jgi:hypothetical protein